VCTPKSIHLRRLRPTEHSAGPRAGGGTARRWYLTKPLSEIRLTKKSRDEAQTAASSGGVDPALRANDFPGKCQYYLKTDDADPGDGNTADVVDSVQGTGAAIVDPVQQRTNDGNRRNECHEEMARREHRTSVSGRRALWCDELSRSLVWIDGQAAAPQSEPAHHYPSAGMPQPCFAPRTPITHVLCIQRDSRRPGQHSHARSRHEVSLRDETSVAGLVRICSKQGTSREIRVCTRIIR
jgi:hypothetical protein